MPIAHPSFCGKKPMEIDVEQFDFGTPQPKLGNPKCLNRPSYLPNISSVGMMCVELKLPMLGNTSGISSSSTPIQAASGTNMLSQGYSGMSLPRPKSRLFFAARDEGNLLNTFFPWRLPPMTKWLP